MKNLFKTTFSLDEKKLSIAGVSKKWKNFHWPENQFPRAKGFS